MELRLNMKKKTLATKKKQILLNLKKSVGFVNSFHMKKTKEKSLQQLLQEL
jgi:hypothetical protein